ncbi:hypothetical protein [Novosphingobium sp. MMS21-SN21R]|uniref:hypothetical protein n=1 Tax=Novosphingobium sp. MMS21-SN21R TaxID=2969298 RepID=UPI0028837A50|nr:hypothetical protein [Novosphingobium sp. MMS21-SN21R]MDT0509323.1 hypothetical protein [Novosphingobium sp. MMS21-SN21R]
MTATKRKPKPITANPMFPLVTALWFGTFLGLGSFAVAPALLEGPVVALGIASVIPAAAPPLGFTARILLALLMLVGGAVAGFLIGRWLGREKIAAPVRTRAFGKGAAEPAFEVRRPINAVQDLGDPLDTPVADDVPLRRRALSLNHEPQLAMPSESAPLPGALPWEPAELDGGEAAPEQLVMPHAEAAPDPLALATFLEEAHAIGAAPFADFAGHDEQQEIAATLPEQVQHVVPVAAEPHVVAVRNSAPPPLLQAHAATATPIEAAPLENLGLVQLIERLALAISRRAAPANAPSAPVAAFVAVSEGAPEPADEPAEYVVVAPPPAPAIARFEAAGPGQQAATAPMEPERVVQLRPAPWQPVAAVLSEAEDDGEFDDEAETQGLDRFLRLSPAKVPGAESDAADVVPEPEVAEDRYPSLLDMGPVAARREPLHIDDGLATDEDEATEIEPVVVFPGQQSPINSGSARPFERPSIAPLAGSPLAAPGRAAPSAAMPDIEATDFIGTPAASVDAEEADRALRAALATLQRMTAQG